ncbi:MAG: uroporphyrinogen decarboxylase family protein [Anaerolineales bacterium]|nr:uroporphyrinogen decarboxylase family protein [Anaerolineales bacterium]
MRGKILELLAGKKIDAQPAFSGLIHITAEGLERERLIFHEVHQDAEKMARAAASTFKLTGMPSATLPLDLCAPAEALGAELTYGEFQFPQVKRALVESAREIEKAIRRGGRIDLICKAIDLVKNDIGKDVVISGMIPGPYTLLLYLCNPTKLFIEMKKEPQAVVDALLHLSAFLAEIGNAYRNAGADFITIHEMGGSAGFIGAAKFEQFVLPALKELHAKLPSPRVLSVCGNMSKSFEALNQTGAEAISLDQTVDLAEARAALKNALLFGNLDPMATLLKGGDSQIAEAVSRAKEARADAVWAGCDLALQTPIQNIRSWRFHSSAL